jgi:hypothetical protein
VTWARLLNIVLAIVLAMVLFTIVFVWSLTGPS